MKLKPFPKFLLIALVAGGVAYGGSVYLDSRPKSVQAEVTQPVQETAQPQQPQQAQVVEQPAQPAPQEQAPAHVDRGMNELLKNSGKK